MREKTVGIYVPSYKRFDNIKTYHILNKCTYVVRKSEEELYRKNGVCDIIAVDDEKIDSFPKVRQWIIDNAPEDIVVQIDDDLERFSYTNKNNTSPIADKDIIDMEIERVAQMISDLGIGFASFRMQENVMKYSSEFLFKGVIGQVCWYNKECLKGKYDENVCFKADIDFELQELLHNRIMLIPSYIQCLAKYDTNAGGNSVKKTSSKVSETVEYLKNKWGKYYKHDYDKNVSKVEVKR